jgi:hypothetical protein
MQCIMLVDRIINHYCKKMPWQYYWPYTRFMIINATEMKLKMPGNTNTYFLLLKHKEFAMVCSPYLWLCNVIKEDLGKIFLFSITVAHSHDIAFTLSDKNICNFSWSPLPGIHILRKQQEFSPKIHANGNEWLTYIIQKWRIFYPLHTLSTSIMKAQVWTCIFIM